MDNTELLEIDGSHLEGGGQILRMALSLSCILKRAIRVVKIRANRPNPGLSNQHFYGLNLLAEITNATVKGNIFKSTEVEFRPKEINSGTYKVNTGTAASISLVLQAALPVLLFGQNMSTLELIGGTNVAMAPQIDFMTEVFRKNLEKFGATFDFELKKRGYYPRGGGVCEVIVPPIRHLCGVNLTNFGVVEEIIGWSYVAGRLPIHLATEMKNSAEANLRRITKQINIEDYKERPDIAADNGAGVILLANTSTNCTIGASALGDRKIDAVGMGTSAANALKEMVELNCCVDTYTQDQLILYMSLAEGESKILTSKLTNHTHAAIYVAELMTGVKFSVEQSGAKLYIISCNGIGFRK